MDIIPAIDLLNGSCVRLYQGNYEQVETFSCDPVIVAQRWVQEGAQRLHIVDLDGAKAGYPVNLSVIGSIVKTLKSQSGSVEIQVGGGLRHRSSVAALFDLGVHQVIIGTAAVENPDFVRQLCGEFPGKILVGIDARDGKVATRGWMKTSAVFASDLAEAMAQIGVSGIIYTDIQRDGTLEGVNQDALRKLVQVISIPVIASGGVGSTSDLLSLLTLEPLGVTGVIVGRALYTGDVIFQEALRAIGSGRWQDVPPEMVSSSFA